MVVNSTILNPPNQQSPQVAQAAIELIKSFSSWLKSNADKVQTSYFIPERGGFGWYVIAKDAAFDIDLNRSLVLYGQELIRRGYPIHATLLPGSVSPTVPTDGLALHTDGGVSAYAD